MNVFAFFFTLAAVSDKKKTVKNANFTAFYGILKKFWSKKIFVLVWSDKVNLPEAQTTHHYDREFFLTYESLPRGVYRKDFCAS